MENGKRLLEEGRKVLDPVFSPLLDSLTRKRVALSSSLVFLKYVMSVEFSETISELQRNTYLDPSFVRGDRLTVLGAWTVSQVRVVFRRLSLVLDQGTLSKMLQLWVTRKLVGLAVGEGGSGGNSSLHGKGTGVDPVVQAEGDPDGLPAKVLPLRKKRKQTG